ncbi:MAG: TetR family transcriptional regulator, partial [Acidimicrobiia bacterium]|nr:TetR family transcriptional regulator [Acidimicrobiia bacterium]
MSTSKSTRVNLAEGGRAARTRRHLLDTALRLFAEHGYEGVRVEDIAREAGLSRAAFYKHFAERDEIIGELLDRLLAPGPGAPGEPGVPGVTGAPAARPADGGEPAGVEADELGTSGRHLDRAVGLLMRTAERMAAQEALARF